MKSLKYVLLIVLVFALASCNPNINGDQENNNDDTEVTNTISDIFLAIDNILENETEQPIENEDGTKTYTLRDYKSTNNVTLSGIIIVKENNIITATLEDIVINGKTISSFNIDENGNITIEGETIESNLIELKDLDNNAIYLIRLNNLVTKRSDLSPNTPLFMINSQYLLLLSEDKDTFSFSTIGTGTYTYEKLGYVDDDMVIDEATEEFSPCIIDGENGKIREEYYFIDLTQLNMDLSNIAIGEITHGTGGGSSFTEIILDKEDFINGGNSNAYSLLDLRGRDYVILHNYMFITESEGNRSKEIRLFNPINISLNEELTIDDELSIFRINANGLADEEYLLRITPAEGYLRNNFSIVYDNGNPRYLNGERRPYLFPLNFSNDSIILYIGKVTSDFIFNFPLNIKASSPYGTIELLPLTEQVLEETGSIAPIAFNVTATEGKVFEFNAPIGQHIIPVIFSAEDESLLSDFSIYFTCSEPDCLLNDEISMVTVSGHKNKIGRSRYVADKEEVINIREDDIIEYLYFSIDNTTGEHHKIEIWCEDF